MPPPATVHMIVEHSADLMVLQGKDGKMSALGYWSQQGFEAFHKVTKTKWSRQTNHCGGRASDNTSASLQIFNSHGREFLLRARRASKSALGGSARFKTQERWKMGRFIAGVFEPREAELEREELILATTTGRHQRCMKRKIVEAATGMAHEDFETMLAGKEIQI